MAGGAGKYGCSYILPRWVSVVGAEKGSSEERWGGRQGETEGE